FFQLNSTSITSLNADNLSSVEDVQLLNQPNLESISFQNLKSPTGHIIIESTSIKEISFKNLESVGVGISIDLNQNLKSITMPELTETGGTLLIGANMNLPSIDANTFPKLSKVGRELILIGRFDTILLPSISNITDAVQIISSGCLDCISVSSQIKKYASAGFTCARESIPGAESFDPSNIDLYIVDSTGTCTAAQTDEVDSYFSTESVSSTVTASGNSTEASQTVSPSKTTSKSSSVTSQSLSPSITASGGFSFLKSIPLYQNILLLAVISIFMA
ncbi:Cell wall protein ecm33, partial [Smittium mucronatum]